MVGISRFDLFAQFIHGFAYANEDSWKELQMFGHWLARKLKFARNIAWWKGLQQRFPDDHDALQALRDMYEEFLTTIEKVSEDDNEWIS
jgi:hypothetical protein